MKAADIFAIGNGDSTLAYYLELQRRGPAGMLAINLFRARKCGAAGDARRVWSIRQLEGALLEHAGALGIAYGWKRDTRCVFGHRHEWVLHVDLPGGQIGFGTPLRGEGREHGGWLHLPDVLLIPERILEYCD